MTMRSQVFGVLMSAAAFGGFAQPVAAQGPGSPPIARPAYSPYLNLVQRGGNNNAALNYYGIVRPQMEFRGALQGLQMQAARNQQTLQTQRDTDPRTGLPVTGHGAYFLNLGGYFMRTGAAGGSRAGNPAMGRPGQGAVPGTAPLPTRR